MHDEDLIALSLLCQGYMEIQKSRIFIPRSVADWKEWFKKPFSSKGYLLKKTAEGGFEEAVEVEALIEFLYDEEAKDIERLTHRVRCANDEIIRLLGS